MRIMCCRDVSLFLRLPLPRHPLRLGDLSHRGVTASSRRASNPPHSGRRRPCRSFLALASCQRRSDFSNPCGARFTDLAARA